MFTTTINHALVTSPVRCLSAGQVRIHTYEVRLSVLRELSQSLLRRNLVISVVLLFDWTFDRRTIFDKGRLDQTIGRASPFALCDDNWNQTLTTLVRLRLLLLLLGYIVVLGLVAL